MKENQSKNPSSLECIGWTAVSILASIGLFTVVGLAGRQYTDWRERIIHDAAVRASMDRVCGVIYTPGPKD